VSALDFTSVREGARVLALLGSLSRYQRAAERWFEIACLCQLNPFVQKCFEVVAMGELVRGSSNDARLLQMS